MKAHRDFGRSQTPARSRALGAFTRLCDSAFVLATVNGVEIAYEVEGAGTPCFVLHGGLGLDHQMYRRTLQPLAEHMRLVFMDVRGNGASGRPSMTDMTIEEMADDVAALAAHLRIDRFMVLGHSWGGFIAQEVMIRHPEAVSGAVLIGTRPGQLGQNESPDEHPIPPRPPGLLRLPLPHDDGSTKDYWEAVAPYFTNCDSLTALRKALDGTLYCYSALMRSDEIYASWSSIDRLGRVTCPVLVIVGSDDLICSPADSARIAERLRQGTLVELVGANHFPWIEAPDHFFNIVSRWLADADLNGCPEPPA